MQRYLCNDEWWYFFFFFDKDEWWYWEREVYIKRKFIPTNKYDIIFYWYKLYNRKMWVPKFYYEEMERGINHVTGLATMKWFDEDPTRKKRNDNIDINWLITQILKDKTKELKPLGFGYIHLNAQLQCL